MNQPITNNFTYSETQVNLRRDNLKYPQILNLSSPRAELTGEISLNGKLIQKFQRKKSVNLDLSSYLSPGKNIVKISGEYYPHSSLVNLEFISPNNTITGQNSGDGRLNYLLVIKVE
jgi:hypothetical protein